MVQDQEELMPLHAALSALTDAVLLRHRLWLVRDDRYLSMWWVMASTGLALGPRKWIARVRCRGQENVEATAMKSVTPEEAADRIRKDFIA